MKDSHYRISLDIHSTQSQVSLPVKQGDTSRKVFISLCEGGKPYHIEDDCFAVFSAKKPDKTIIENNCIIADNVIEYTFTEQTTSAIGVVACEIKLYGVDSGLITSPRFTVIVDSRAVSDEEIESKSEYTALTELYAETRVLRDEVETKLANGEFDGEDVDYNLVSNALKGSASGESVTLTDVSSLEHEMKVTVSGLPATLQISGKNLFDAERGADTPRYGLAMSKNADGTYNFSGNIKQEWYYTDTYILPIPIKAGCNVTISSSFESYYAETYAGIVLRDADDNVLIQGNNLKNGDFKSVTLEKDAVKAGVVWRFPSFPVGDYIEVNNAKFQLEPGTTATEYEPYKEPATYTPNADGTVEGVTSLYPTTILTTDTEGVTIDVEYNRDANKVVAELLDIIINGKSFVTDVKIFASKWVGTASPYSQIVTVEGATSRSQVDLTPSAEQLSIFHNKDLAFVTENNNGIITVYAIGQKPMNDYTIQATVTEVKA